VCTLFGRELRGEPFMRLWDEASRELVGALVPTVADEAVAVVAGVAARTTEGSHADLKLLLPPPLYHRGRTHGRLLGVLAPISAHCRLGAERVGALEIEALRHLGAVVETLRVPGMPGHDAASPSTTVVASE